MMTVPLMNMIVCFSQFKYGMVVRVKKFSLKQHLAFACSCLSACTEKYEQWLPQSGHYVKLSAR